MNYYNDFLTFLKLSYYKKSTIKKYEFYLKRFFNYLLEKKCTNEQEVTENIIKEYLVYLKKSNASNVLNCLYTTTVSVLKKYFQYLEDNKIIFISPMRNIENIKEIHKIKSVLSESEIKEILDKIPTKTDWNIRFKTIMELMYSSSLRPCEVINLKIIDIDFSKKILFIEKSKFNKTRIVPITDIALFWLSKYIKEIRGKYIPKGASNYVFASRTTGNKLTYRSFHHIIERGIIRYKLKHFNPHLLRATSATHLLNNGMSTLYIKELLGHERIETTQRYLRIKAKDTKEQIDKNHPRYINKRRIK